MSDWRELNKNLFSALKLEKIATFIILSIAILVASFCIICTLLLMVTEKGKEIAILKAVGATDSAILAGLHDRGHHHRRHRHRPRRGDRLAFCLSLSVTAFGSIPRSITSIGSPWRSIASDYVAVAIAALLSAPSPHIYPARAASQLRPVEGLR